MSNETIGFAVSDTDVIVVTLKPVESHKRTNPCNWLYGCPRVCGKALECAECPATRGNAMRLTRTQATEYWKKSRILLSIIERMKREAH